MGGLLWTVHILVSNSLSETVGLLSVLNSLYNIALVLVILGIAAATGRKLLKRWLSPELSRVMQWCLSCGVGLGLLSYLMFGLGLLGLYYGPVGGILLLGLTWLSRAELRLLLREIREGGAVFRSIRLTWFDRAMLGLFALLVLLLLSKALAPPLEYDVLMYHLEAPKRFIEAHRFLPLPDVNGGQFPFGLEMLYTLTLLVGNDSAAQILHLAMGLLATVGLFELARGLMSRFAAWVSIAVLWTNVVVGALATTAMVDLGGLFYDVLAVAMLLMWVRRGGRRWLVFAAVSVGVSMAIKYLGIYTLIALVMVVGLHTWRRDRDWRGAVSRVVLVGVVAAVVAAPWYGKNWLWYGNPVEPFYATLFHPSAMASREGASPLDTQSYKYAIEGATLTNEVYGGALSAQAWWRIYTQRNPLLIFWDLYAHGALFRSTVPSGPLSVLTLVIPLYLLLPKRRFATYLLIMAGIRSALWPTGPFLFRYLLPVIAWLGIPVAYIMETPVRRGRRWKPWLFGAQVIVLSLVLVQVGLNGYYVAQTQPWRYALGLQSRREYLAENLASYATTEYINRELPTTSRLLMLGEDRGYYLERDYLPGTKYLRVWWAHMNQQDGDRVTFAWLRQEGVTHILRHEVVRPSVMPDSAFRAEHIAFQHFRQHYLDVIFADAVRGYYLYALRAQ